VHNCTRVVKLNHTGRFKLYCQCASIYRTTASEETTCSHLPSRQLIADQIQNWCTKPTR